MSLLFSDKNIGDEITITVRVVEDKDNKRGCQECAFINFDCGLISCSRAERPDGKNVIFEERKD